MTFLRNRQELEHALILMHQEGGSIRELSRAFHLGRNTVRRILRAHAQRRDVGHDLLTKRLTRASKLDRFDPEIKRLLDKYPGITGLRLYEELKEAGYPGGISIVRERLKTLRASDREPVIRFETEPGQQGQMDWSPYTISFTRTGKCQVQCFSYILGFSRRHYIDFTPHHDFYSLIRRHQDAFEYFGGVPRECLYDNEKTVVLRWECARPVFNPAFTAFITHYQCKPIACRPGRPETKGKIEAPFQYVEGNLLNGRAFQDLEDLRARARWWLKEKSDPHIHDTTRHAPLELFAQETLQPLPIHPYDSSEVALRVCGPDGCIEFETNHYSIPSGHIADILSLKATEHEILIYTPEIDLIARHQRYPAGLGKRVEDPSHFMTKKKRYGLEPIREAFLELGERAEEFLKGLTQRHPRNCGFHARSILRMKEHYRSEDIHGAIEHAIRYQAFEGGAIERILRARATPRTLESIRNERARQELEQALPKITQRPLNQYSELLGEEDNDHAGGDPDTDQAAPRDPETSGNTEGP
ncbi:MAG TPA: IS21 family transposase [Syntrophobacteraceae bacterium]|jgi:transposase|nr:IS21 family transposase [Syntrophobacteraceae bacterium]